MRSKKKRESTDHVLVDIGACAGALTGAIVGAAAGPAGVVAGSAVGAGLGTLAGAVLDRESHQKDAHDRELDDAIGVTAGDISARDSIRRTFDAERERVEAHRRALEADLEKR